jgi:hypothetical protein
VTSGDSRRKTVLIGRCLLRGTHARRTHAQEPGKVSTFYDYCECFSKTPSVVRVSAPAESRFHEARAIVRRESTSSTVHRSNSPLL